MLVQGDLRLLALALIAEAARYGYEITRRTAADARRARLAPRLAPEPSSTRCLLVPGIVCQSQKSPLCFNGIFRGR